MSRNNKELDEEFIALVRAFSETAQRLSFTEAASALQITPSTLSRRVQKLEGTLGVKLLHRTTRSVSLTEAGAFYLERIVNLLDQIDEANAVISTMGALPAGRLRISVPATFGRWHIAPLVPSFMSRYPEIRIDMQFTDDYVDLFDEGIDVAVRIGELEDSSLVARKLFVNRRRFVASPQYLKSYGTPQHPHDLAKHKCLHFSRLMSGQNWVMEKDQVVERVPINPSLSANDASALYETALAGGGIALLADFITADAIAAGRLVQVLSTWSIPETHVFAAYPGGGYTPAKTRVFIDYLTETLSAPDIEV